LKTTIKGKRVLIIDDDDLFCDAVVDFLGDRGLLVAKATTGQAGLDAVSAGRLDVVLLDQRLPDGPGQDLCQSILRANEETKIIFITAHASYDGAAEALAAGAHDYLSKPVELEELYLAIVQALRIKALEHVIEVERYRRDRDSQESPLIGAEGALADVARMIQVAATSDAPVLITGETGSGKNVVAKNIHYQAVRRSGPFIPINCAALPENLIESELFGYERGAFTGAETSRRGVFEMAEGGTLFLDEIGDMPMHLQTKLLSAIEDGQIKRLGGEKFIPVDMRIVAATAADLDQALGDTFREDLYFRLSVVRIHLPPLRERTADLPALCEHLLRQSTHGRSVEVDPQDIPRLADYRWPGNVRELKNVLERAALLQRGPRIQPSVLLGRTPGADGHDTHRAGADGPADAGSEPTRQGPVRPLEDMVRKYTIWALDQHQGNYTQTAKTLGIALSTLKRKLRKYGLR
jgi:DNA-binding NtrC family response regulator